MITPQRRNSGTPERRDAEATGLDLFRGELSPAVLDEIERWQADGELGKLRTSLRSISDRDKFLDTYAEAVIARHLLSRGCRLRAEVLTPSGRSCDFEVTAGGIRFFLHVKRLNTEQATRRSVTVSSRLRYLERIARPYIVGIHLREGLSEEAMQRYVTSASEFIMRARVGDEIAIRNGRGEELGRCRVIAPWNGSHVSLVLGLPAGFADEAPRIRRLLRKAYQQFMPGAANVILICSGNAQDSDDVETALLGSHIERWDTVPPEGRRVAHGRDSDGFWHESRFPESGAAGWFHFRPETETPRGRLWIRAGTALDPDLTELLATLFNGVKSPNDE